MRRFCLFVPVLLTLVPFAGSALAGPDADLDARAKILAAEMRRRSADLVEYLQPEAEPALRRLAIRALGRIGDDGNAPGILRDILATEKRDLGLAIWAAGIARSDELAEPLADKLASLLKAGDLENASGAAKALGWTGGEDVGATLAPLLGHADGGVRVGALIGLARAAPADRDLLDTASKLAHDEDPRVCDAADFACWTMGRALSAKMRANSGEDGAETKDMKWNGEPEIAERFLPHLSHHNPEKRMGGVRVLGTLLPAKIDPDGPFGVVANVIKDEDPRVVQDAILRIFTRRTGDWMDGCLVWGLASEDPKTRARAITALGGHESDKSLSLLVAHWDAEEDPRCRETLTIELARRGKEEYWKRLQTAERAKDAVVRQLTDAQVLLLSKRPEAIKELFDWADPGASQRAGLHAAAWMTVLDGVAEKKGEVPDLDAWLKGFIDGGYAVRRDDRPFVISTAVQAVGKRKRHGLSGDLLKMLGRARSGPPHDEIHETKLHVELRMALMGAFAELAGDEACPAQTAAAMKAAVTKHMHDDPSPWVRLKARDAARKLKMEDVPDIDEGQPTDWKGVPRAETRVAGVDPDGDSEYLDEKEILQLADWIAREKPWIVFETTAGRFTVALDPHAAPVHSVSLLNAVRNGVYRSTRWHRVVPNFVIQGGDPHGHGGGGGGWNVPDEISPKPYVRGALGMPKSVKDDGGCQLFFMHSAYHPLDERYTCYGHVTQGMDTVDRIRVGDFITKAYVAVKLR